MHDLRSKTLSFICVGSVGSVPPSSAFFDVNAEARGRTTSLPMKNSLRGKKKEKGKRTAIKDFFRSMTDIRAAESEGDKLEENVAEKSGASRRHSSSPTKSGSSSSMARALSYDVLDSEPVNEEEPIKKPESNFASRKTSSGEFSFLLNFTDLVFAGFSELLCYIFCFKFV